MAERMVYVALSNGELVRPTLVGFEWAKGLSASQKKKNVERLHEGFCRQYPERKVLEISRYSNQELGIKLSAFNLMMPLRDGRRVSVECAYQAGKVFEKGGPYLDLLNGTSMNAKKDDRLKTSGKIIGFELLGEFYPMIPKTFYYNWLYINALHSQKELADALMEYNAFTDIVFNQEKQINCQAEAAACYVALRSLGLIEEALKSKEDFLRIVYNGGKVNTKNMDRKKTVSVSVVKNVEKKEEGVYESCFRTGDKVIHPKFGEGEVIKITLKTGSATLEIRFENEIKCLDEKWILSKCKKI